jgi:hypothetical protein
MRKYILAILLISSGLFLLIYTYSQNKKTNYSETLFSKETQIFDRTFSNFIYGAKKNIDTIKSIYNNLSKIKDTTYTREFFLNYINNDPYLNSAVLVQNDFKVAVIKEDKSIIYTLDSVQNQDIVRWQRYENKSHISSWKESFDRPINKSSWYRNLNKHKDQIQWSFDVVSDDGNNSNLFLYAGYSFQKRDVLNTILLRFTRKNIIESLHLNYENTNIKIESLLGNKLDIGNENSSSLVKNSFADSLNTYISDHFQKFDQEESGTFNFNFKNEVYWNSFKRYPSGTGIKYYLFTIPNSDLQLKNTNSIFESLKWIGLFLIGIGLFLLLIRKRFFYRSNRIEIPPANELLKEDENRYLEFKSSSRWDYRQEKANPDLEKVVLKTLAAFGNTDGGILLIGVDDDKNILGLEKDFNSLKKPSADYYEIHLRNILHNLMGVKYVSKNIRMQFEICEDQKVICKIKVIAADEPLYLKYKNKNGQIEEKFYVRSGNSSQEIRSIAEINDYINTRFKK